MVPRKSRVHRGDRMPKMRFAAVLLATTGVAGAVLLTTPLGRRSVDDLLDGHLPPFGRHRPLASRQPVAAPREATLGQEGPHKVTARASDEPLIAAPDQPAAVAVSAAQSAAPPATEVDPPAGPSLAQTDPDAARVRQAIALYRKNDLVGGDALAQGATGALARTTMEWAALRLLPRDVGLGREDAFVLAHPDWPSMPWLKRRIEEAVAAQREDVTGSIDSRLSAAPLQTVTGKLALAKLERARGQAATTSQIVKGVWRTDDLTPYQETSILHDFGDIVDKSDHRYRADRFLYKEQIVPALREAAAAGPDYLMLARARVAVLANAASDAAIAAVPKALQTDPGLIYARIQKARRANRIEEAADLMLAAPRDPAVLIDPDAWWVERRILARKLLDMGDTRRAYQVTAEHSAASPGMKIEAEFHAGWIALRFMNEPKLAAPHFAKIADWAETPISKARAAYWQGRTAEAAGDPAAAAKFYDAASQFPIVFYGQLAAAKLGRFELALRSPAPAASGEARGDAVRVAEYLFGLGERELALPLALDMARFDPSESQVGAMASVVANARDAWATLAVGKAATQRGMALDEVAFPTFGIPEFQPLRNSADLAIVYAIARQESEFDQRSLSSAGAKGLMQMISSTAKRTAEHAGIGYDDSRMATDAAFNAQLGAAHLGELMGELGGSYILTFAAYNAGGKNVKDWIDAYGDPRKPGVDPVDWIERIPFTETRNYVQRVIENLQIYRVRLGRPAGLAAIGPEAPALPGKGT